MSLYKSNNTDFDSIFAPLHAGWPQASATGYKVAGADLNTKYAKQSSGSAVVSPVRYRDTGGNDLITYFAALGSTGVQVGTQPGAVSGSAAAGVPSGTVTSGTTTCAGAKGGGTYTYTWIQVSGPAIVFTAPNSQTTAVRAVVNSNSTINGTFLCQISDGVTTVNTNTVAFSLHNTSVFTPVTHTFTTPGAGSDTAPAGATQVVIEAKGGGAGSSTDGFTQAYACGGGGAAYCRSVYACTGGQSINHFVGSPGSTNLNNNGTPGTASTVTSGSLTITPMTANGGGGAAVNGVGGTASGGNQVNATGASGVNGGAGGVSGSAGEFFDTGNTLGHGGTFDGINTTGAFVSYHYT